MSLRVYYCLAKTYQTASTGSRLAVTSVCEWIHQQLLHEKFSLNFHKISSVLLKND
jgi:hypothetical protein